MPQAAEAVDDAKLVIADVLERRATEHVALSYDETTTLEACLGIPCVKAAVSRAGRL